MNQSTISIEQNASHLGAVLLNGSLSQDGQIWVALPRERVKISEEVTSIIFELTRPQDLARPSRWQVWMRACRMETLTLTGMPCLAVLSYGLGQGWQADWGIGLSSLLAAIFLQMSVYILSDVEDYLRLLSLSAVKSRVLEKGWLNAKELRFFGVGLLVLGGLLGLPALWIRSSDLSFLGISGVLGLLAFVGRPFSLKYRVWADAVVFALLGPLLAAGFSLALFGQLDWTVGAVGIAFGLLASAIFHANSLQDIPDDQSEGILSFAVRLGFGGSRYFLLGLYALCLFVLVGGSFLGLYSYWIAGICLAATPLLFRVGRQVMKASGPASALISGIRNETLRIHWAIGALLSLGFRLASYFNFR